MCSFAPPTVPDRCHGPHAVSRDDTVFVVDDDDGVRDALAVTLYAEGLGVHVFESGPAVLSALEKVRPYCLVLDVHMPVVSGLAVLDTLAERHIEVPVVMITGHIGRDIRRRALTRGAHVFLKKPFTNKELVQAISTARAACGATG